jgi:hypothetical protein
VNLALVREEAALVELLLEVVALLRRGLGSPAQPTAPRLSASKSAQTGIPVALFWAVALSF